MEEFEEEDFYFDPEQQSRLEKSIQDVLSKFFGKYNFFCGGPVPIKLLLSKESLKIILGIQFDPGIQYLYEQILTRFKSPLLPISQSEVDWHIQIVLKLLGECRKSHIPIDYQAGVLLLYFKFCHGVRDLTYDNFSEWLTLQSV